MNKSKLTRFMLLSGLLAGLNAGAQNRNGMPKDGYTTLDGGLQYKLIKHGDGNRKPAIGDHIEMHIHVQVNDSTMFDSRSMYGNKPVPFQVQKPNYKGDAVLGFMQMVAGDSAVMRLPVDSISKQGKPLAPNMKDGDMLNYQVTMLSVMSEDEFRKDQEMKLQLQNTIDDKLLEAYFKSKNIKAQKTASGLYYTINKAGTGAKPTTGQLVSVNYTGRLLGSEKAFDSNTDPEFRHQEPFTVTLGTGGVIKGWDEGLALLSKGTKATLYIPSALGYGPQDRSPQIPSNSILVFDVEITKISTKEAMEKEAAAKSKGQNDVDDKLIKEYAAKNKLKTIKTASGLHYVITKPGQGPKPQPGDKVMVKYNGTFLDGNKFDGNMDRTEPFTFELGKGMVIKGWDEGIALLNKGAKATLLIPSYIAYGAQARGPIPANAVLVFDVELEDFQKK